MVDEHGIILKISFIHPFLLITFFLIIASNPQQNDVNREVERLEDDIKTLNKMLGLSDTISIAHQVCSLLNRHLFIRMGSFK